MGFFSKIFGKKEPSMFETMGRYTMEADLLPKLLLGDDGISVATAILEEEGKFFVRLYSSLGSRCPYSARDFSVKNFKFDENRYMLEITMPKPEMPPLCERLIITIDFSIRVIRYITVEMDIIGGPFLCEWKLDDTNNRDGKTHLNYGEFTKSKLREIIGWQ